MITRRAALALIGAALATRGNAETQYDQIGTPFSPGSVDEIAEALAARPYSPPQAVPQGWADLDYDMARHIWFPDRSALWNDTDRPGRLDLFPPGAYTTRGVNVWVVEENNAQRVAFDLEVFDKTDQFPDLPEEGVGYSGIRMRAPLRRPNIHEEFCVFQGASYFRAIGTGQTYGLSARGLALKTGDPMGEEFPDFTDFWVEAPLEGDKSFRIHALLDSPSTTGAYHFTITPGATAEVAVRATLFPRVPLNNVGLAPLTSMFLFDETNRHRFNDYRTAVHDSEALMIANGAGESLWRPLANPGALQFSAFVDNSPRGFGLVQKTRDPEAYGDLEARYENRPSLWITPGENWGEGSIILVEIPADKEIYDNIVAYWRPRHDLQPGQAHNFTYRMAWGGDPDGPAVAQVQNTRMGNAVFGDPGIITTVDFAPHPELRNLEGLRPVLATSRGTITDGVLTPNPATGGVRLGFKFNPGEEPQTELRAQLVRDTVTVSQVWLYRWTA